jgi:hypothetical protein
VDCVESGPERSGESVADERFCNVHELAEAPALVKRSSAPLALMLTKASPAVLSARGSFCA